MASKQSNSTHTSQTRISPKLRDSCSACARSKVKCTKEKPTCTRCTIRGMECEYFVTRRGGRKRKTRPSAKASMIQTNSFTLQTPTSTPPSLTQSVTGQQSQGLRYPDISLDASPSVDPSPPSWMFTDVSTEIDNLLTPPLSFHPTELADSDSLSQSLLLGGNDRKEGFDRDDTTIFLPDNTFLIDNGVPSPLHGLPKLISPSDSQYSTSDTEGFQSVCSGSPCCLIRAIGFLKYLLRNTVTSCTLLKKQGYKIQAACQSSTLESDIAENEQILEAIHTILHCSCSLDEYFLSVVSLIILKLLGWYAAVAQHMSEAVLVLDSSLGPSKALSGQHRSLPCHAQQRREISASVGCCRLHSMNQDRMEALLVLGTLHRIQLLIHQLSHRLKDAKRQEMACEGESGSAFSFSAGMSNQHEAGVCQQLHALSSEIIDNLRWKV